MSELSLDEKNRALKPILILFDEMLTVFDMTPTEKISVYMNAMMNVAISCGKTKKDLLHLLSILMDSFSNDDWQDLLEKSRKEK